MSFVDELRARASRAQRRIAFPESDDARIVDAVERLAVDKIVRPVVILERPLAGRRFRPMVEVLDPSNDPRTARARDALLERRGSKGLTADDATRLAASSLYFADYLVRAGEVEGCVAGCVRTTAEVMRAALWLVTVYFVIVFTP